MTVCVCVCVCVNYSLLVRGNCRDSPAELDRSFCLHRAKEKVAVWRQILCGAGKRILSFFKFWKKFHKIFFAEPSVQLSLLQASPTKLLATAAGWLYQVFERFERWDNIYSFTPARSMLISRWCPWRASTWRMLCVCSVVRAVKRQLWE